MLQTTNARSTRPRIKAVDVSTGRTTGYARWRAGLEEEPIVDEPVISALMDEELLREVKEKTKACEERCMGGRKDFWFVQSLATHPDYQDKGIARLLMQYGMQLAHQGGNDIYLEATPSALGLYERLGFQQLDKVEQMDGRYVLTAVLRKKEAQGN